MPQRAVIKEKDGTQDVLAYELSDKQWYGAIEAAQAKRLKLPCCGVNALPKSSETMIRHFSHPPYTLQNCHAKKTGEAHDAIVASVAQMAAGLGWKVTPEAKFEDIICDLVCEREASGFRIGFEFETGTRSKEVIEKTEKILCGGAVSALYWFFKKGRKGGLPSVTHSSIFNASCDDKGIAAITSQCLGILVEIEELFETAKKFLKSLKEQKIKYQINMKDGFPESITTFPEGRDRPHIIKFERDRFEVISPNTEVDANNFEQGEKTAKAQETLINIVRRNLKEGYSLWWDGHPNLLKDSFKRLRENIHQTHMVKSKNAYEDEFGREQMQEGPANFSNDTLFSIRPDEGHLSNNSFSSTAYHSSTSSIQSESSSFVEMRIKEVMAFLRYHFGDNYVAELLDKPMVEIGNLSPRQLVEEKSQALELIQVGLGYRDPVTKKNIKPIPALKLE
ncbi:hypothetical protein [Sneathiella sp.]|jgi:hypothetical protein|uniref:hypothetical protein n=1 Tax=Sneathiella sp. TaxID=1964365 RepID=UPI0039E501C2